MEYKKEEALKALKTAEKYFIERNLVDAKRYALEAQSLYPGLHGAPQMVASLDIYLASQARVNGEIDYYSILGLKPTADDKRVNNQFNRLTVLLQRNRNKVVGADGALKLVSEAWSVLSDQAKRSAYDMRRKKQLTTQSNLPTLSSFHSTATTHFDHSHIAPVPHQRLDTFWTICTSCKVQYEYLRKYLNKKLSCKNCGGIFMAVETGINPINGSYSSRKWSPMPTNGYTSNNVNGVQYYPANSVVYTENGIQLRPGTEYSSNLSFQWSSSPKTSASPVIPNTLSTNGNFNVKSAEKRKLVDQANNSTQVSSKPSIAYRNPLLTKNGKIDKRRRLDTSADLKCMYKDTISNTPEVRLPYASTGVAADHSLKAYICSQPQVRRFEVTPSFNIRNVLLNRAKIEIKSKLEEMKLAAKSAAPAEKNMAQCVESLKPIEVDRKSEPISISVPDPDFHDFDKDRSEQCFKEKQIWAIYDEEDGMPRLYCTIRQVLSLDPFSMHITYLSSKTCGEFGSVDWVTAGFTKSCGNFNTSHSETVDSVNIFSHALKDDIKVGRGGRVRIYPRGGDIWAVYRNWSPEWDDFTPDEVKRQYDMVEVVNDYTEDCGVHIFPLVKLDGYNTVYRRSADETAMRWIPKKEMFRFSHQVPSWILDVHGLPDGCWDLDPAATPDTLLDLTNQSHETDEPKTSVVPKINVHHDDNDVHVSESSKCIVELEVLGLEVEQLDAQLANEQAAPSEVNPYPEVKHDQAQDTEMYADAEPLPNLNKFQFADIQAAIQKVEIQCPTVTEPQSANVLSASTEVDPYPKDQHDLAQDTKMNADAEPPRNLRDCMNKFNSADIQAAIQKVEIRCPTELTVTEGEVTPDLNQNAHFHYSDECVSIEPKQKLKVNQYSNASENVPHPPANQGQST